MKNKTIFHVFKEVFDEVGRLNDILGDHEEAEERVKEKKKKRKKKRKNLNNIFEQEMRDFQQAQEDSSTREAARAERQRDEAASRKAKAQNAEEKRRILRKEATERAHRKERERHKKLAADSVSKAVAEAKKKWTAEQKIRDELVQREAALAESRFHPRQPGYLPKSYVAAPAIILKPLMDKVATGKETIRLGGLPQLPEHIEWPRADRDMDLYTAPHFYAQIDLASLPRRLTGPGYDLALPDFPQVGTLFVFHQLQAELINEAEPYLIFVSEPVADLPERAPPPNCVPLQGWEDRYLRADGIAPGGLALRRQYLHPLVYMSARHPNFSDAEQAIEKGEVSRAPETVAALQTANLELTLNEDRTNPEPGPDDNHWDRYVWESTRIAPTTKPLTSPHRFVMERRQIQMFGHGDDVQMASQHQAGKVMLLQIGDCFGTPLDIADVAIQIWIDPVDLAAGRFDRVVSTLDCS